jgi:hypothetical protein
MAELATAAQQASRARDLMRREIEKLDEAHGRNEALIVATHAHLQDHGAASSDERLKSRLANLEALHASNHLARAQAVMAIDNLGGLLDRYQEIGKLLYPVWQQHALAVAQSAVSPDDFSSEVSALNGIQTKFDQALRYSKDSSE